MSTLPSHITLSARAYAGADRTPEPDASHQFQRNQNLITRHDECTGTAFGPPDYCPALHKRKNKPCV